MKRPLGSKYLSLWAHVPQGPKDPILGVTEAFNADTVGHKLNLGVGAYRDDDGKPVVLPSVKEASRRIVDSNLNNEYSPIDGDAEFVRLSLSLALGDQRYESLSSRMAATQSLSGTGSLRLLGEFIKSFWPDKENLPKVYAPSPTWGNHFSIFQQAGLETGTYRYYKPSTCGLDYEGLLEDINAMADKQVILLHASAHNPTGVDPTEQQWMTISNAIKAKGHFVLFDMAYQGFASGSPDKDAFAVRYFVDQGHDIALSQSFAKNLGLYGHRIGAAAILLQDKEEATRVKSQVKILARAMYSNPPIHGARIVKIVLGDPILRAQWMGEVGDMASRIILMRKMLREELERLGSTRPWNHITEQIGMFCFSGLSPEQVQKLQSDHHIYMTSNGRISMAGLSSKTVGQLAKAIHSVTTEGA